MLLLYTELPKVAIGGQRVRHIAKCALNRLLVSQEQLLVLCLRQSNVGFQPSTLEDRLGNISDQRPNPRRSGEQIGQRSTLVSRGPRQRNLRKVSGPGNADFRVCRNEIFFGFANVRSALQKRRRKSNGNLRRMRLLGELQAPRNVPWVISQKNADGVFFLCNLPL